MGVPYRNLRGHTSVGVLNPNSRGHAKVWESLTPTRGPCRSVGGLKPNFTGHIEAWESITSTGGATSKCGTR